LINAAGEKKKGKWVDGKLVSLVDVPVPPED